ncbi:MAG TPA: ABC transporter permease [Planctomycetes bacterium]|nr:ABC transporter permease [Planctomycetota bacterium]
MISFLRKTIAFMKRDFRIATSYPLAFFLGMGGIFFSVLVWFFLSRMMNQVHMKDLDRYGGYFAFVIVGIALQNYLAVAMGGLTRSIRESQMLGTLEMLLATPTGLPTIVFASSITPFIVTTLRILVYFLFGAFWGVTFHVADPMALVLAVVLSILSFATFGIFSASVILVVKRGDPVALLVGAFSTLLSGIYYPVRVLPGWLQQVAWFVPVTHAAEAWRDLVLSGATFSQVSGHLAWLAAFTALFLPLSLLSFGYAIRLARLHGTLAHF